MSDESGPRDGEPAQDLDPIPELTESERVAAEAVFGDQLPAALRYVEHLCTTGITHGLLGPREIPRMWSRHVLNCGVIAPELPSDGAVADIGSGAGLPGLVLALARPDVEFSLIEPMERRVDWLEAVIEDLGLLNVRVIRARAEELADEVMVDVVTARAVTGLKKLLPITVPLLDDEGELILLKGRSAGEEISAAAKAIKKARLAEPVIELLGVGLLDEPTTVVRARRQ